MKHIFVVNPCAGGRDRSGDIATETARLGLDAEVYVTCAKGDATRFVASRCNEAYCEPLRFYACGGDGTLNEVVSGAIGHSGVEVSCYPCGSGNDFVRYFGNTDFLSLKKLLNATAQAVDVVRLTVDDRNSYCYAVNTLNFGFEAAVCRTMDEVRRKPFIGGPMAYTTGILTSLIKSRHHRCRVTVDGEEWLDGEVLLLSLANGQWAGGGYHCAPRAVADDGMMEVMSVKPLSIVRFAKLIKYYKNGQWLDREELNSIVNYRRGRSVVIEAGASTTVATDGELVHGQHFAIEVLPKALLFAVPKPFIS